MVMGPDVILPLFSVFGFAVAHATFLPCFNRRFGCRTCLSRDRTKHFVLRCTGNEINDEIATVVHLLSWSSKKELEVNLVDNVFLS